MLERPEEVDGPDPIETNNGSRIVDGDQTITQDSSVDCSGLDS